MGGALSSNGERRGVYRILVSKSDRKRSLGRQGLDGMMIFMWIFRNRDVWVWTGLNWLRIETGGGHL
jgi:hypothetical protein